MLTLLLASWEEEGEVAEGVADKEGEDGHGAGDPEGEASWVGGDDDADAGAVHVVADDGEGERDAGEGPAGPPHPPAAAGEEHQRQRRRGRLGRRVPAHPLPQIIDLGGLGIRQLDALLRLSSTKTIMICRSMDRNVQHASTVEGLRAGV